MRIDQLPQDLKERAERNAKNRNNDLFAAFIWDHAPEGFRFWKYAYKGQFDAARALLSRPVTDDVQPGEKDPNDYDNKNN